MYQQEPLKFDIIRRLKFGEVRRNKNSWWTGNCGAAGYLAKIHSQSTKKIREHTISRTLQKDVSLAHKYDEGVSYKFRELARNEHSAAPSVFPTTTRRIQNRTQVSYSQRGVEWSLVINRRVNQSKLNGQSPKYTFQPRRRASQWEPTTKQPPFPCKS